MPRELTPDDLKRDIDADLDAFRNELNNLGEAIIIRSLWDADNFSYAHILWFLREAVHHYGWRETPDLKRLIRNLSMYEIAMREGMNAAMLYRLSQE